MLIAIGLENGKEIRMEADAYEYSELSKCWKVLNKKGGYVVNSYFNACNITYIGPTEFLYRGDQKNEI